MRKVEAFFKKIPKRGDQKYQREETRLWVDFTKRRGLFQKKMREKIGLQVDLSKV